MYYLDTWLMYCGCTTDALYPNTRLDQQEFYVALAEELINNNLQQTHTQQRTHQNHKERDNLGAEDIINLAPQL